MKKTFVIFLILILIFFTAIIKNSTKKIEEDIFITEENIRDLEKDFGNLKLEYEYLSSAEKLLKFQDLYFDDELVKKDIQEIEFINKGFIEIELESLRLENE